MNKKDLFDNMCKAITDNTMFVYPHELCKDRFDIISNLAIKYDIPIMTDRMELVYDYHNIGIENYKHIYLLPPDFELFYDFDTVLLDLSKREYKEVFDCIERLPNKNFVGFI